MMPVGAAKRYQRFRTWRQISYRVSDNSRAGWRTDCTRPRKCLANLFDYSDWRARCAFSGELEFARRQPSADKGLYTLIKVCMLHIVEGGAARIDAVPLSLNSACGRLVTGNRGANLAGAYAPRQRGNRCPSPRWVFQITRWPRSRPSPSAFSVRLPAAIWAFLGLTYA